MADRVITEDALSESGSDVHHHHDTHDLYLAPALAALRFSLDRIGRQDGGAWFVSASNTAILDLLDRSCRSQLLENAGAFADSVRGLKSALHPTAVAR